MFLSTVGGAALLAFLTPNSYTGIVRLKTDTQTNGVSDVVKTVTSESVLYPVISELGLRRKWGATHSASGELDLSEAYARLVRRIEIRRIAQTTLTDVRVSDSDKQAAAGIANAIARSYTREPLAQQLKGLRALQEQWNNTTQDISRLHQSLAEKAREAGMVETTQGWTNAPVLADAWLALQRETLNKKASKQDTNTSQLAKDLELAEKYRPFYEEQQNLQILEKVATILKRRISAGKVEAGLANPRLIVDMATPPRFPSRPNKPLMIFCGILLGTPLALILGAASALLVLRSSAVRGSKVQ